MFHGLLHLPGATHVLQSPCGPVIREGRGVVHRSGKAFKAPPRQDWPTAQRVNRQISQFLRENQGHPTCRAVRKESKVFVGSGEGSRLALSTAGKCMKQSSHGFCIANSERGFYDCFRRKSITAPWCQSVHVLPLWRIRPSESHWAVLFQDKKVQ